MKLPRLLFASWLAAIVPLPAAPLADSAAAATPLVVGAAPPAATVRAPDGRAVDLTELTARRATVLIFYRGGWCPYCQRHLAALAEVEGELRQLGYQILALSPERPETLARAPESTALKLLSDREMHAASAFGLAFRVDEKTRQAYAGYGIDLAPIPGEPGDGRWLPVPTVVILDPHGRVRFVHADADYKRRLAPAELLAAARAALSAARP